MTVKHKYVQHSGRAVGTRTHGPWIESFMGTLQLYRKVYIKRY